MHSQFPTGKGLGSHSPLLTEEFYSSSTVYKDAIPGWNLFHIPYYHPQENVWPPPTHIRGPSQFPMPFLFFLPSFPLLAREGYPWQPRWQPHIPAGSKQPCRAAQARPPGSQAGEQE